MARLASSSIMKSAMAACRRPVSAPRIVKNAVPQPSSPGNSRKVFSRFFCMRGAIVSLESLLPLHNAEAKSHFVSKLSSGDLCVPFLLQGCSGQLMHVKWD